MKVIHVYTVTLLVPVNGVSGGFEFSNWSEADLDGKANKLFQMDGLD